MSFASLPQELKLRILLESVQQPQEDLHQAATLARVSKNCYSVMTDLLWKHLRITTPSRLRRLQAAAEVGPALVGSITQSIHIGPDNALAAQGWPLRIKVYGDGLKVCLITTLPQNLLPGWASPGMGFDFEYADEHICEYWAVGRAVEHAFKALDVDSRRTGWSHERGSNRKIGNRAWALRLWQAQAALNLYLAEMRHEEQSRQHDTPAYQKSRSGYGAGRRGNDCLFGACGHYPALNLVTVPATKAAANSHSEQSQTLVLTMDQLRQHLAGPDSTTDHFDHLLLFARLRKAELEMNEGEWRALKRQLGGPNRDLFSTSSEDGEDDDDDTESTESDEADWDQQDLIGVEKAEDLLWSAWSVLAFTMKVTNLSLTGFLHRAISGLHTTDSLRRLNLGPFAPRWLHILYQLTHGDFACSFDSEGESGSETDDGEETMLGLIRLRICGMISSGDARKIATQLPRLRTVVWEYTDQTDYEGEVLGVVQALQGRKGQRMADGKWSKRYTEVRLRPSAVTTLLAAAPRRETRRAWSENGRVARTLHPINVMESRNVVEEEGAAEEDSDYEELMDAAAKATADGQHREAQSWWEQGRVGLGLHSSAGEEG